MRGFQISGVRISAVSLYNLWKKRFSPGCFGTGYFYHKSHPTSKCGVAVLHWYWDHLSCPPTAPVAPLGLLLHLNGAGIYKFMWASNKYIDTKLTHVLMWTGIILWGYFWIVIKTKYPGNEKIYGLIQHVNGHAISHVKNCILDQKINAIES